MWHGTELVTTLHFTLFFCIESQIKDVKKWCSSREITNIKLVLTELIDNQQCAGSEKAVDERVQKLMTEWDTLTVKSSEKSKKLQEANRQRMYTAAVKDLEFWLGEVSLNE